MKIIIAIDDSHAEKVMDAWLREIEASPMAHLDKRKKEEKFRDIIQQCIISKYKNYRTEETIKQAIAAETKVADTIITTTLETIVKEREVIK